MAKARKFLSPKKVRKAIRKNPYAFGVTAALAAAGGVAAALSRGGVRRIKDRFAGRLNSASASGVGERAARESSASEPY